MADIILQGGLTALADGDLAGAPDVRLALVCGSFSGESEPEAINVADISVLDEFVGVGYQRIDCDNVDFSYDSGSAEFRLTFDAGEFNAAGGSVAAGPNDAEGLVAILYVDSTAANDIIIGYTTEGAFPLNGVGTAIEYTPDADGILYMKQAA